MKVSLVQMNIAWADPVQNRKIAEEAILATPGSDLYVLPEMWSTGFATIPEGIAEPEESDSLEWMKLISSNVSAAIAGSIAVHCDDGTYRNRFYFVKPSGEVTYYDKHHLFTYGGEHHRYSAGNERVVVEWLGVRFRLIVCYDLRFPKWIRSEEDYDAILCVASWPTPRVEAWRTLLKARAIENQCYVCGVNRVGDDPSCNYVGGTAFVDPYGKATECEDTVSGVLTADIDMSEEQDFKGIGSTTNPFTGTFDGKDHTISNLNFKTGSYAALFGKVVGISDNETYNLPRRTKVRQTDLLV